MPSYKELLATRESLNQQIEAARATELGEAISRVKSLIEEFGLTQADVFGNKRSARSGTGTKKPVAPKYRDPSTGQTWSGRGKAPKWIAGKDRALFPV